MKRSADGTCDTRQPRASFCEQACNSNRSLARGLSSFATCLLITNVTDLATVATHDQKQETRRTLLPFIHERGYLCDFEVITDELCSQVGTCLALLDDDHRSRSGLRLLQPLCWHVNGSIRGRLAIAEEDMDWLHQRYDHYRKELTACVRFSFYPAVRSWPCSLHRAILGKKAIRAIVRLQEQDQQPPEILGRFCNLLCNFFLSLQALLIIETPPRGAVRQRSYGQK